MKNYVRQIALAFLCALLLSPAARAAITGQWNFDANLSASIGQPIYALDSDTDAGSSFGTTTSFGIPNIGGEVAKVMKFPKTVAASGGYGVPTGALPNGGGALVNVYTIIMDVLFPEASQNKRRSLADISLSGDAEYAIQADNGIGSGSSSDGKIVSNTWHRIVFAADLSATPAVVDKYIDGVKVGSERVSGLDSTLALYDLLYLFSDDNDESEAGYINSLQIRDEKLTDGLIAALGAPTAAGILTGPPPNPYVSLVLPSAETARIPSRSTVPPNAQIKVVIENGATKLVTGSVLFKLDDVTVTPEIAQDGNTTTLTFTAATLFEALSVHKVSMTFSDDASPANKLGTQWQFAVGPFAPVSASVALPSDSASTPGFKARTVQGPEYIQEVNNLTNLAATVTRGIQQLNGTLRDITGAVVADESTRGPNSDGSYDVNVLNFSTDEEVGNFTGDSPFPGIPGANGHSTQFTTELLGFLQLQAGTYQLGVAVNASRVDVNDDDNFALYIGLNPRDAFSQVLGSYVRSTAPAFDENSQNQNEFTFFVAQSGLYPIRLVYVQSGRKGSLELYSIDTTTGEKILVNDVSNAKAIKAFRTSSSSKSGAPYVAELSPRPGTSGNDPAEPIQILIQDERTQLNVSSLQLSFNGATVTPTTVKSGTRTTVTYSPNAARTETTNRLSLVYADNASTPNLFTNNWIFTSTVQGGGTAAVRGQWDFDQGTLAATVGSPLEYFDGAGGETEQKTAFGTTTSFGIPDIGGQPASVVKVPGDLSNKIGYTMRHGISANGGGTKVNQYTLIFDLLIATNGPGAASLIQIDDANNTSDGDLFWQGNNFGQGQGGYLGTGIFTPGAWHRVAIAVDLAATPAVITKFVDGVKQDDWKTDGLDGRRALRDSAILFGDGDQDERRVWYVNSIQIRDGKLSDGELAYLGAPSPAGIPRTLPDVTVKGQWDFNGNLNATVGSPLTYFDGAGGDTETKTEFGTATSFGLPALPGGEATVMKVPGDLSNKIGYVMNHGITPNGGGTKVNQYTLIYDLVIATNGPGAASLIQIDEGNNTSDGDLFWQGNNFGQGQGGYLGTGIFTPGEWHRVALAVDLAATPAVITKFVDGVKQDDWKTDGLDGRRALRDSAILFGDGDQDERRVWYVNSIQIHSRKLTDDELTALGTPTAQGLPLTTGGGSSEEATLAVALDTGGLRLSWAASLTGFTLESTPSLTNPVWTAVSGVNNNSVVVAKSDAQRFFRLRK